MQDMGESGMDVIATAPEAPIIEGSLAERIARQAALHPDAPAMVDWSGRTLTYDALRTALRQMGETLRACGLARNARVAILLPNGLELALGTAAVSAHAVGVPLDPKLTGEEIASLDTRLTLDALLTIGPDAPLAGFAPRPLAGTDFEGWVLHVRDKVRRDDGAPANADTVALVLRTSGTTALPKLVPLTHRNMVARGERLEHWLALTMHDRIFSLAPLYYAHGLETALFTPLATGGSVAFAPRLGQHEQAADSLHWLCTLGATWYSAGPTFQLNLLDRALSRGLPANKLRLIQTAGAPLAERTHQELEETFGVPVLDAYGTSETGQPASNAIDPTARKPNTVGRPMPGLVELWDETDQPVPDGERGEIVVRGPSVSPYYLEQDGTRPLLDRGWYRTGDMGIIDADGFLAISGRLKETINRGGEKIAPAEIDKALLAHPAVSQALAFPVPHPRLGEDLAAAVVLRPGASATPLDLRTFLKDQLVPFKVPRRIHLVDTLPKGATGKPSRPALTAQFGALSERQRTGSRSVLEEEIMALWARLLNLDYVNRDEDFFELGGDSLLAVQMLLELETQLDRKLSQTLLFEAATPRELAHAILNDAGDQGLLYPLRTEGKKPPYLFFDGDLTGGGFYAKRILAGLDEDRPMYILRPVQPKDGRVPPIEEMARDYLALVREAGLKGPFALGGHCNGALTAMAVAHLLEKEGEKVDVVTIIDPISLNARRHITALYGTLGLGWRLAGHDANARGERMIALQERLWKRLSKTYPFGLRVSLPVRRWLKGEWAPLRSKQVTAPDQEQPESATDASHGNVLDIYRGAMARHVPRRLKAKIVCLSPKQSSPRHIYVPRYWRNVSRSVDVVRIPGGHLTCLTSESPTLVAKLREALTRYAG